MNFLEREENYENVHILQPFYDILESNPLKPFNINFEEITYHNHKHLTFFILKQTDHLRLLPK